jgi:hypothetical protein
MKTVYQDYVIEGFYMKPEYFDIVIPGKDATDALDQLKQFIPEDAENLTVEVVMPESEYQLAS